MSGFSPQVFAWFEGLERDNTKAYFTATRDFYEEEVRGGLESLLDELRDEVGGDVLVRRQQRDLRFTPDKTPYKTRTYGHVGRLYVAISATGLYAGTGYYQLMRDQLDRYREAVADDVKGPPFEAAVLTPTSISRGKRFAPRRAGTRATIRGSSCCGASS